MAPGGRKLRELPCEGNGCQATRLTLAIHVWGGAIPLTTIANTVRTNSYSESRTTLKCGFVSSEEALSLRALFWKDTMMKKFSLRLMQSMVILLAAVVLVEAQFATDEPQNEVEVRGTFSIPSGEANFASGANSDSTISFSRDFDFS